MATTKFALEARYGKQSVPVFKVTKTTGSVYEVSDLIVKIMLSGVIHDSWEKGMNGQILPTETQKNTCYAIACETSYTSPEDYAVALGSDILKRHHHIMGINIDIVERKWERIRSPLTPDGHPHAFVSARDPVKHTASVSLSGDGSGASTVEKIVSGVCDINILKTAMSGFEGFIKDKYTNLVPVGSSPEAASSSRLLCTQLSASWVVSKSRQNKKKDNTEIFSTLLQTWVGPASGTYSRSLQETAYNSATAVLMKHPYVDEVRLETPNIHYYNYEEHLKKFGVESRENEEVFQSTDPHYTASGRIVTHLYRKSSPLKSRL